MPRKALLGNWFEEEAYMRDRKRLLDSCDRGVVDAARETQRIIAKVKHHNSAYPMAEPHEDGYLHFYAPLMLQNAATLGFLSLDLEDRTLRPTGWHVACSTAPAAGPALRNCFVLVPAPTGPTDMIPAPPDEQDIVHYGQPFFIMTVPELCDNPLSLLSEPKGPLSASKVTGKHQDVFFSPDGASAEAMWVADFANPDHREDMRDLPIKADAVLVIRHNHTNTPLASSKAVFFNDFGPENEVCCGRFVNNPGTPCGPMKDENYWTFVHSENGEGDVEKGGETTTPVAENEVSVMTSTNGDKL
ncbi:calpain-like cysteine peptidase, putative [Trypanosoma brucei brucei TREU927]|uniref:Calpain-like cysteine peptidase, putative n=1 Tax=Trypanosoma brucei brucei (strain 927/4 GUTat10.1) TaxID=185431 RepID=Q381R3_TRYB2|nr:calpain-like cysteine peptidase, putative [Trypanosoma brucei brucei TREU927]EAN80468.1 calpain-like cysteine peptidase, putative [Trypanosoma brucei brucei TREU927]